MIRYCDTINVFSLNHDDTYLSGDNQPIIIFIYSSSLFSSHDRVSYFISWWKIECCIVGDGAEMVLEKQYN